MTRLLSTILILLLVTGGTIAGYWIRGFNINQQNAQKYKGEMESDLPIFHTEKDKNLPKGIQTIYGELVCKVKADENENRFPKECTVTYDNEQEPRKLPELSSTSLLDHEEYVWAGKDGDKRYVLTKGYDVVPGGGQSEYVYLLSEEGKLQKIFSCFSGICSSTLKYGRGYGDLSYINLDSSATSTILNLVTIENGGITKTPIAVIPKDNNGWSLGRNCGDAAPCLPPPYPLTFLDNNHVALGFGRATKNAPGAYIEESTYVVVPIR